MSAISKFGRRYDREFKEKAIALVLSGRSQGEVSRVETFYNSRRRHSSLGQRSPRDFEALMFPHHQNIPTH